MARFAWDERKRIENLGRHGLDFIGAPHVFDNPTPTFEDDRFDYGEQRFMTLGLLEGIVVSVLNTETPEIIRIISFRKVTSREQAICFAQIGN